MSCHFWIVLCKRLMDVLMQDPGARRKPHLTILSPCDSIAAMITDFHDEETSKVWHGKFSRRLPNQIQEVARRKLRMVNNAQRIEDLRIPPNNRLEALKGDRAGQWSIRINDQWRVCFEWKDGHASRVEICDYH